MKKFILLAFSFAILCSFTSGQTTKVDAFKETWERALQAANDLSQELQLLPIQQVEDMTSGKTVPTVAIKMKLKAVQEYIQALKALLPPNSTVEVLKQKLSLYYNPGPCQIACNVAWVACLWNNGYWCGMDCNLGCNLLRDVCLSSCPQ